MITITSFQQTSAYYTRYYDGKVLLMEILRVVAMATHTKRPEGGEIIPDFGGELYTYNGITMSLLPSNDIIIYYLPNEFTITPFVF